MEYIGRTYVHRGVTFVVCEEALKDAEAVYGLDLLFVAGKGIDRMLFAADQFEGDFRVKLTIEMEPPDGDQSQFQVRVQRVYKE